MTIRDSLRPIVHGVRNVFGTNGLADRVAALHAALEHSLPRQEAAPADVVAQPAEPAPPPSPPPPVPEPPRINPNMQLHNARGAMLRQMPPGANRLLSAGPAGLWYFDWVEQCYGPVPEHIGIEYYMPRPDGLPPNVTWIENTASDMSDVPDASCDLVFSGQNVEHMWPEEVTGFFTEAARVVRPGGHLVVDSPNRDLTALLNWSQPEHTVELTPAEGRRLFELAGFEVTKVVGLWLCRDPRTRRVLAYDPNQPEVDWSVTERLVAATAFPDHAFLWWVEGRRTERAPDAAAIAALVDQVFRDGWPERIQRLAVMPEWPVESDADGVWVVVPPGRSGMVFQGPGMPLRAGSYRCTLTLRPDPAPAGSVGAYAACDVVSGEWATVLATQQVMPGQTEAVLDFELAELTFGVQFRCTSLGNSGFAVRRAIALEEFGPGAGAA